MQGKGRKGNLLGNSAHLVPDKVQDGQSRRAAVNMHTEIVLLEEQGS